MGEGAKEVASFVCHQIRNAWDFKFNLIMRTKFRFFLEPSMQALKNLGLGVNVSQVFLSHNHKSDGSKSSPEPDANHLYQKLLLLI